MKIIIIMILFRLSREQLILIAIKRNTLNLEKMLSELPWRVKSYVKLGLLNFVD